MSWTFYDAYYFLKNHPLFEGRFWEALDIYVEKVNPDTNSIDDDDNKNTKTAVWLETGGQVPEEERIPIGCSPFYHDINLDCGGDTFEEAIIKLANLVLKYYGRESKEPIIEEDDTLFDSY
jgi:hypothetical protein